MTLSLVGDKVLPSIYSLFKKTQEKTSEIDRQKLAQEVFDNIAEEDYGTYLREALGRLVHTDLNQTGRALATSIRILHEDIATHVETSRASKPGRGQVLGVVNTDSLSSKRDDLSARRLARFSLPESAADGSNIRLGQSTYDDLVFQAERLILHGESAIADGKERKRWAQALEANGVKTLEELPKDVLDALGL